MFSRPGPEDVLYELGDKLVVGLIDATAGAKQDLTDLRESRPAWVSRMAERTLANLVHDRLWAHLVDAIGEGRDIVVRDAEPYRELLVGRFRIRVKRHDQRDLIRTYPTRGAMEFWGQNPALPGLGEITLGAGYRWLPDERDIGSALISYREGWDNPIWAVELGQPEGGTTAFIWTPTTDPSLPEIDLYEASQELGEDEQP